MQVMPDNSSRAAMRLSTLNRKEAESSLLNTSGRVYLLLDGARFENIHRFIYQQIEHPEYRPLYRGTFFEPVIDVSPCLVDISRAKDKMLSWYFEEGANKRQGIVLSSNLDLRELTLHLQNFLEARLPTKQIVLFRFYDPAVLNALTKFPKNKSVSELLQPFDLIIWEIHKQLFTMSSLFDE